MNDECGFVCKNDSWQCYLEGEDCGRCYFEYDCMMCVNEDCKLREKEMIKE